jgi:hypothetical protein
MKKLNSRVVAVCALFALPAQLLLPGSLSAQEHEDAARQAGTATTVEERLEQRIDELERARLQYEAATAQQEQLQQRVEELEKLNASYTAAIKEQERLRMRLAELERTKPTDEHAATEHEHLERRLQELETTTIAHEDATRTIIQQSLSTMGSKVNEFVTLGGTFEAVTGWSETFGDLRDGTRPSSDQDIRLNTAELDLEILVNDWTLGSIIFAYDDGQDAVFHTVDEFDTSVDRINVDTAFVTVGDTQRFPVLAQAGRMIVPFGISTGAAVGDVLTVSDPLTVEAFETKEDAILIGVEFPTPPTTPPTLIPSPPPVRPQLVQPLVSKLARNLGYRPYPKARPVETFTTRPPTPPPFTAAVYTYSGDTFTGLRPKSWERNKHWGATVGYRTSLDCSHYSPQLGADKPRLGWLHFFCPGGIDLDVDFNNSVFDSRFLEVEYRDFLRDIGYVDGMALSAKANLGPLSLVAEWNGALEHAKFTAHDLLRLRRKPSAWQITTAYQLDWNPGVETIGTQGTYLAFGYSASRDLEGVTRTTGLVNRGRVGWTPKRRYLVTVGEWIADGLRLAIEYQHNVDYSKSEGGTGRSADAFLSMLTYEW